MLILQRADDKDQIWHGPGKGGGSSRGTDNVEYEGEESALDEEEWQLLFNLNDRVAELERAIQLWMGQQ